MNLSSTVLLFLGVPVLSASLAAACDSVSCEETGSCGDYPAGTAGSQSGTAGQSGAGAGGTAGSTAGRGGAGMGGIAGETGGAGATGGETASGGDSGTGGEAGDSGNGGAGGTEPCGGDCTGAKPVCHAPTDTCVECTSSTHCDDAAPVCDTTSRTCVECTATEADACDGATPVCDPDTKACVECLGNESCTETTASLCDANNECAPCVDDGDCSHLSGTGVCDGGECVECTPANEMACGANSCNPATNRCTGTPRGTKGLCEPCLADSECIGGDQSDPEQRCVSMQFKGVPRAGGFCLRRASRGCVSPYVTLKSVPSLSGASDEAYCSVAETITRCEAVLDFAASRTCPTGEDTACGCARDEDGSCVEAGAGGACRTIGTSPNRCTYPCGAIDSCPIGKSCTGIPTSYCE